MVRTALVLVLAAAEVACGGPPATTSAVTPSPTAVSAKAVVGAPADFAPLSLTACPSPETGTFAEFAAAYRTDVKFHANIASIATLLTQAAADTWVSSLAAPDAKPDVCHGMLGFAYAGRDVEPVVQSYAFVFKDSAAAKATYAQLQPLLVPSPSGSVSPDLGPDASATLGAGIARMTWLRGSVVAFLLTQDVDNWKTGANAIDARMPK